MNVIASRSAPVQILGFMAYLVVIPLLFLIGSVPGYLMGPALAELSGLDPEIASDRAGLASSILIGLALSFCLLREAWARVYSEVRADKERLELDRAGKTHTWQLLHVKDLKVRAQSRRAGGAGVTEITLCLVGPDGRRLHLTEKSGATDRLLQDIAERMADKLSSQVEKESVKIGPSWDDCLNVYKLGPILFLLGVPAALEIFWAGPLLTVAYVVYLGWSLRRRCAVVQADGIRFGTSGKFATWADIRSTTQNHTELIVETKDNRYVVEGPNNLLPLGKLIERKQKP